MATSHRARREEEAMSIHTTTMNWVCSWLHGGGDIKRDSQGRINWQCRKCGRWSDAIPIADENYLVEKELKRKESKP